MVIPRPTDGQVGSYGSILFDSRETEEAAIISDTRMTLT